MSAPTATTAPAKKTTPADLVHQAEANEWGQIVNLEPHAQYFIVRRPTAQMTREMSNQMLDDLKAFVAAQREVAAKQMAEINEKVLPRALDTAQQVREQVERRVDMLTREFEARVERLEAQLGDRAPTFLRREKSPEGAPAARPEPPAGSAPGELPMGHESGPSSAEPAASSSSPSAPAPKRKTAGRKGE
jgi:hypothetical protein